MMWKRKSTENDALYIDLFEDIRSTSVYREAIKEISNTSQKDDRLALSYRKEGNGEFTKNNFDKAIIFYNKCMCFAENGSENISFALANRAFCFLNLELYEQCLVDIELAKKANYPEHLLPKLEKRKSNCLMLLETAEKRTSFRPKLSFPAHEHIPSLANALKIERSDKFGRHIVAQCDIKVDQTVLIEEPMIAVLRGSEYKRCQSCLKDNQNLIACTKCTNAMFCSQICCNDQFHKYECNMKNIKFFEGSNGVNTRTNVNFLIRTTLTALNIFSSTTEMMLFVNSCLAEKDLNDISISDGSPKSNFLTFLKFYHVPSNQIVAELYRLIACIAYDILMDFPEIKVKYELISTQRFLMHLLTHFTAMFKANNVLLQEWSNDMEIVLKCDGLETYGAGLFNIGSYFNHACMPNVMKLANDRFSIVKTIQPIQKGDQIFIRYAVMPNQPTAQRREQLLQGCGFKCNCELCKANGPTLFDNPELKSGFKGLGMQMAPLLLSPNIDADALKSMKQKWFKFLDKYRRIPTSESIILAYENLKLIFSMEIKSC